MTIDDIYDDATALGKKLTDKARQARRTAKAARAAGNLRKADKFNALARVYEMTLQDVTAIVIDLNDHISDEKAARQGIPF